MRFVLYARKSQEREDRQIQSLDDQKSLASKWAKEKNLVIIHTIAEARSAKTQGTRAGFKEMVEWINRGKADGIICWHPDRLARNAVDGGWVLDLLDRGKLKEIVFTSGFHFENSPEGKFMLNMVFSQAKYQVDKLIKDVTRGMASKREKGEYPHPAPQGWKNVRIMATGQKRIEVDQERFTLLRDAIDLILSDTLVPAQALLRLNKEWGFRTKPTKKRPSGPLTRASFYRLLANPFLMGQCRHGGELYLGAHTPMVTPAEFEQIQAVLTRREKHRTKLHTPMVSSPASEAEPSGQSRFIQHDFALTGLMRCAACGRGMITATRAKGHVYYHCTNQRGRCTRKGIREEAVFGEINGHLGRVYLPESLGALLLTLTEQHIEKLGVSEKAHGESARERWQAALDKVQDQQDKLRGLLLREVLSEADYVRENARLSHEEEVLHEQLSERESEANKTARMLQAAQEVVGFVTTAPIAFPSAFPNEKRQIVRYLSGSALPEGKHPRPSLHVSRTGENVLLKPHPLLVPFISHNSAFGPVEPVKSGSGKQKRLSEFRSVSFGRPVATLEQLAADLCEQIERLLLASGDPLLIAPMHRRPSPDKAFPYTIYEA